jgi:hypothetical protein
MDTVERFDRVADYLLECFSNGEATVSKDDVIDDAGTVLSTEAFAVLDEIRESGLSIGDGKAVEALDTFVQAWNQGYDLASGNDMTDNDDPVSAVLSQYRLAKPGAAPTGPRL